MVTSKVNLASQIKTGKSKAILLARA